MTRIDQLIQQIRNSHVYIQSHNFPDPDSIASAYGLQKLLESRGIESTICYMGEIDRYNTLKMIELLQIQLINIADLAEVLTDTDEIILVDAQKGNSNILKMKGQQIACIDHHPTYEEVEYLYKDIRVEIGACATMIAEYFFECGATMDQRTATALSFGIRCDTDRLLRGTSFTDMEMLYFMYQNCDREIIQLLESRELYFNDLMSYSQAIDNIRVFKNISFASTNEDCPEALIANISDFMLALVEVEFSVVYSVRKDGVKLSVRSEGIKYDAGKITSQALKGIGSGGGHSSMAGGFIPMDGTEGMTSRQIILEKLESRFLEELRKVG
ncbi:MAG: DHH family phosphoesterase [Lachnospiraceae bacterium]